MLGTQTRWNLVVVSPRTVLESYRVLLNSCLPKSLLPGLMKMELSNLPYAYPTVKRKCFKGDMQHQTSKCIMKTCQNNRNSNAGRNSPTTYTSRIYGYLMCFGLAGLGGPLLGKGLLGG